MIYMMNVLKWMTPAVPLGVRALIDDGGKFAIVATLLDLTEFLDTTLTFQ